MVISQIISGLGNQLFQYAAGLAQAKLHKTSLKLDATWFDEHIEKQTPRKFELSYFKIQAPLASEFEIKSFTQAPTQGLHHRIRNKYKSYQPYYKQLVYKEPHFHFDPNFFKTNKSVYLAGYWQTERYFLPLAEMLRADLKPVKAPSEQNRGLLNNLKEQNAISVHVRRTDMVNNPDVQKVHGACSLDYYLAAMGHMEQSIRNPVFYVFSDDPAWCKQHILSAFPLHIVEHNQGDDSYWDLVLMNHCKHHIIANSSFSWWGAWLNPRLDKQVIAPAKWFNDPLKNTKDVVPPGWMRI